MGSSGSNAAASRFKVSSGTAFFTPGKQQTPRAARARARTAGARPAPRGQQPPRLAANPCRPWGANTLSLPGPRLPPRTPLPPKSVRVDAMMAPPSTPDTRAPHEASGDAPRAPLVRAARSRPPPPPPPSVQRSGPGFRFTWEDKVGGQRGHLGLEGGRGDELGAGEGRLERAGEPVGRDGSGWQRASRQAGGRARGRHGERVCLGTVGGARAPSRYRIRLSSSA